MKISRRNFLSLGAGITAGAAISPVPWKLMDDISIWTQNWPWTPVPENGEVSFVNSTCTLCNGGCGITVRKIENRAVKIEGMKDHPINNGGVCMLGISGLQLLYDSKLRVKSPLKRVGFRGEGKFEAISWDKAISEVVERLGALRETNGQSHTLAGIFDKDSGTVPNLFKRFFKAFGSPNYIKMPSYHDAYESALGLMHGNYSLPAFDFDNSDFILSFGADILDGWDSQPRLFRIRSNWIKNSVKFIQIEPRLSNSAAKSDKWIPVKPGTEAALALGIAHVIIKESLYKADFVNGYTNGFDKFKDLVIKNYAPGLVSKVTGIDTDTLVSLARDFAKAKSPLAIFGQGKSNVPGSINNAIAIHSLNALIGNINKNGGIWTLQKPDYINWPEVENDPKSIEGLKKQRIDAAGEGKYQFVQNLSHKFIDNIIHTKSSPVKALLIYGANPLYSLSDTDLVKKAFEKIDYIVSFNSFLDETSKFSDIILPGHVYLEKTEDFCSPAGYTKPFIGLLKPVLAPRFDTKHTGDIIITLAKKLGGNIASSFTWENYEDCLKKTVGEKWQTLNDKGFWIDNIYGPPLWENSFKTPSGKFEFVLNEMETNSDSVVIKLLGDSSAFPLTLISYDSVRLSNNQISPPFILKTVEDTILKANDIFIEINPSTAKDLNLSEGDFASLTTPKGWAIVRVHLYDGIMPGIISMPKGLGHNSGGDYIAGKGVNINKLIGPVEDPVSGLDDFWGIKAKITKV